MSDRYKVASSEAYSSLDLHLLEKPLPLVVVLQPHNIVFAEIVSKLYFYQGQRVIGTVAEPMIGFGGNVYMLAFFQLQRAIATDNVGDSFNHNPMFAAA